jgi:hypothetical protein
LNINTFKNTWIKLSFIWLILASNHSALAHGDDFTQVEITLEIPAIDKTLKTHNGELINLTQAYLSSFSFELIACPQINLKPKMDNKISLLSWLIPVANANHGVSFTKPTQIPVQQRHNLLVNNEINLGLFKLPKGKYCQMNYTLGKVPGKQGLSAQIKSTSLFIEGNKANLDSPHQIAKSDYAFGKNFPINLEIPPSHKTLSLVISVDVNEALKALVYATPSHKNARNTFLSLSEQVLLRLK